MICFLLFNIFSLSSVLTEVVEFGTYYNRFSELTTLLALNICHYPFVTFVDYRQQGKQPGVKSEPVIMTCLLPLSFLLIKL